MISPNFSKSRIVLIFLILVTGCAAVSKEQFFALSSATPGPKAIYAGIDRDVSIEVVDIPEMIDRPQIVLFTSATGVSILDNERWAETVKSGITRVLNKNLSASLPEAWVAPAPNEHTPNPIRVIVHVEEMTATAEGKVVLTASWIVRADADKLNTSGRLALTRDTKLPMQAGEVVALWSDELGKLSESIAASIETIEVEPIHHYVKAKFKCPGASYVQMSGLTFPFCA